MNNNQNLNLYVVNETRIIMLVPTSGVSDHLSSRTFKS